LNIPENNKVLLYIGKFYRLKGVDIILKTFEDLKNKYDIELILIGGSPSDPLYEQVKASGARVYGYLPNNELPPFYNAADVYLLPAISSDYAGIDVTFIEALACGVPVVSQILKEFLIMGIEKLGKIPKDETDITRCISEIFKDPEIFKDCRETARKYFDWKTIMNKTIKLYDALFEQYYG
jgi:glycosyltransferase involved in cell wall biosynthesis